MHRLIDGYRAFRKGVWPDKRKRYEELSQFGQQPETLVIACSDSRVDPQTVFGAGPGEIFMVRSVAGLVPPYQPDGTYHGTSAALEYGVRVLKVKRVVLLSHAQCGGVQALVGGMPPEVEDFLGPWMSIADSVLAEKPAEGEDPVLFYETAVTSLSLKNLETFPWVQEAVSSGQLEIAAFRFGIFDGKLQRLEDGVFVEVPEEA